MEFVTYWKSYLLAKLPNRTEHGAALVEYALLLALIAVVCIVAVGLTLGTKAEVPSSPTSSAAKLSERSEDGLSRSPRCAPDGPRSGPERSFSAGDPAPARNEPNVPSRPARDYRYLEKAAAPPGARPERNHHMEFVTYWKSYLLASSRTGREGCGSGGVRPPPGPHRGGLHRGRRH